VKTTAPKLYCVRPNSGLLAPGASESVTIIFQGLHEEPPLGFKCKDKFLFVSIPCSADIAIDPKDVSSHWAELEQQAAGKSEDIKIKVLFSYDNPMNTIQEEDKSMVSSSGVSKGDGHAVVPVIASPEIDQIRSSGVQTSATESDLNIKARQAAPVSVKGANADASAATASASATIAPPATKSKTESSGTSFYIIAILFVIAAFLLSRML
jgi:vesicle-associated membrane protein-associated protein A